jgi:hypothetical protein
MYPELADTPHSAKDRIVNILSYDWPLNVKRIYFFLKKRYGCKTTYQAVYKAVKEMLTNQILEKTKEGYKLNLGWVKDVHNQTEIIRVNYFSEQHAAIFDKNEGSEAIRAFIFKTWFDVEKYLYYLQKNYILNTKEKQTICIHHAHEWRPLFYLRAEYNWIKKLRASRHSLFTLCSGDSVIDRWSAVFYNKIGSRIKINKKISEVPEIIAFGDLVIQTYIPFELRDKLDKYLKKIKKIEEIDYLFLIKEVFEKEAEIKVIINKDKILASQIKNQTLSEFKRI